MQTVRLIKAEKLRRILVICFYCASAFTLIYFLNRARTPEEQFQYLFILLLLPVGIYLEILRYFYAKANDALNIDCDAARCYKLITIVEKADLIRRFKVSVCYLKGFALLSLNRSGEVKEMIEKQLGAGMTAKRKLDFEYNYLMFSIAAVRDDKAELKSSYENMRRIFKLSKRISGDIRSLESLIDAIYQCRTHQYKAAEASFARIRAGALKPHEQAYYYYYLAILCSETKREDDAHSYYEKACETAPKIPYITEVNPCPPKNVKNKKTKNK